MMAVQLSVCEREYVTLPLLPRFPAYFLPAPSYLRLHGFTFCFGLIFAIG